MAKAPTVPAPRRTRPGSASARPTPAAPVVAVKAAAPAAPKPRTSPAKFVAEVRAEARKITWPTWKETWITSVMVFIMVAFTAVFFFIVDAGSGFLISSLLKLAG